jgi:hypothetical protein
MVVLGGWVLLRSEVPLYVKMLRVVVEGSPVALRPATRILGSRFLVLAGVPRL